MKHRLKKPSSFMPSSLRGKMAVLTTGVVLLAVLATGGLYYHQIGQITEAMALTRLAGETRLIAQRFKDTYKMMHVNAEVISRTPPIAGLMRTRENNGIDQLDGSTEAQWRHRLATIFASQMVPHPSYTQMRLIGVADGREWVRVNRTPRGLAIVPPDQLQRKDKEPYFTEALKLAPGEGYYSDITYNRERGRIDGTFTPTLRMVLPVYSENRQMFAMIVINADYAMLMKNILLDIQPPEDTLLISPGNDYMMYEAESGTVSELHMAEETAQQPPIVEAARGVTDAEAVLSFGNTIAYFVKVPLERAKNPHAFTLALSLPRDKLFAGAYRLRNQGILIALAIVAFALALTWIVNRPLRQMTRQIKAFAHNGQLNLPTHLRDEVGDLARAFTGMAENLNMAHLTELQLSSQLQGIIEHTPDGLISIDHAGGITVFNPACEQIFGYKAEEVLGKNVRILMPEPHRSQHNQYLARYQRTGKARILDSRQEVEGRRKDGSTFPMYLRVREVNLGGEIMFTAIIQDITERKKMEEDLRNSNAELERFAYVASHDLKAPLRAIDNLSQWIREDLGEALQGESRENMDLLQKRVQRMENLLNDLLEYSRADRTDSESDITDARSLVEDITTLLVPKAGFTIMPSAELAEIEVTRIPLQQVLHNLVSNALKHHDKETGTIEIDVTTRKKHHTFSVKDDGPGIEETYHEQIFDMFRTLRPRDEVEGSGMGLALVRKIVRRQGGDIWLESAPGAGTTFFFTWPVLKAQENKTKKAA